MTLAGARWVVRSTPERLVRIATDFLLDEGFVHRDDSFGDVAGVHDSGWVATSLEIGEQQRPRRFHVLRRPQPITSRTLVVATARSVSRDVAELVVFPHPSDQDGSDAARIAAPRLTLALEGITAAAGAEGAMLSYEPLTSIAADDTSPAGPSTVRDVLGWR
ncbi:hypothetical protein [Microbacterium sp. NPDC090003]|uniref:hypothetical protein n=1 Tax=Microbacterium sp. NPDC090003 TaxID=3364203 RepID=UPI00380929A3